MTAASGTGSITRHVGSAAVVKILVMGMSGVLGIITSRLIIANFGTQAYAQYGLLSTMTSLLPFADLGMAAVLINTMAGSKDPSNDPVVRRTITTAFRILIGSGTVIILVGLGITFAGLWPTLLGNGLIPGSGSTSAIVSLVIFSVVLPLTLGQRVLIGLNRNTTQLAAQVVVAPFILLVIGTAALLALPIGGYLAIVSYVGNAFVSVICIVLAARLISPQIVAAARDIPRIRTARGVKAMNVAWPMLVQMLALPIAMQTDRLLLSHITTGDQLAQYNLAAQLFGIVLQATAAAGIALWPYYAKARSEDLVRSPVKPMSVFAGVALAMALVLAIFAPVLTRFVSAGQFTLGGWLIGGFVAFCVVQAAKYPLGMYMTDSRGLRFQVLPILVLVPLNLALSWVLVGRLGAAGTIIGSTVAVFLCQVIPNLLYVRHDLRRRRAQDLGATELVDQPW